MDINFVESSLGGPGPGAPQATAKAATPAKDAAKKAEAAKLKSLGYVGSPTQRSQRVNPDWTHVNAVDYNPALDQILISIHEFSEIWIIDHSTTAAEAAGHTGGRSGRGVTCSIAGETHGSIARAPRKTRRSSLSTTPSGSARDSLVKVIFSSSTTATGARMATTLRSTSWSRRSTRRGTISTSRGRRSGPKPPSGATAPKKSDFFATFISGTHRLPNGNTMICSGPNGTLFEVTPQKELVWKYVNPVKGGFGPGGPVRARRTAAAQPGAGAVHAGHAGALVRSEEGLDNLQKTVDVTLEEVLTDQQKKNVRERGAPGPGAMGAMPVPGQIMSVATQLMLKPHPNRRPGCPIFRRTSMPSSTSF